EARGIFVMPRPEKAQAYFGAITDAAGRHTPPRRPGDATSVQWS
ncbi:MAG: PaaI family thioesterase, partial [Arsenicicoccus sp.]